MLLNCGAREDSLKSALDGKRSNQSVLKEINPEYSLEGLMMKLQYFGHLMWRVDYGKDPDDGKDWRQKKKGVAEVEVVGWHHWLNGHEFEPALGDGEGQKSLACCNPWDCKESDMTEWLNNNKKEIYRYHIREYNAIFEMLLLLSILFFRFTCSVVPVACIFLNYYYYSWILFQCMGIPHFFFQSVYQLIDIQIVHSLGLLWMCCCEHYRYKSFVWRSVFIWMNGQYSLDG